MHLMHVPHCAPEKSLLVVITTSNSIFEAICTTDFWLITFKTLLLFVNHFFKARLNVGCKESDLWEGPLRHDGSSFVLKYILMLWFVL